MPACSRASIALRLFFFLVVVAKGFDRLRFAAIWAEDGSVFLKDAFEIGWASLLLPYDGYFHTVPRLIALTAAWLPVTTVPAYIVLVCYAIFAYTITLLLCPPYRWLFGSRGMALVCVVLLLLSPGQIVMLGNGVNLHWYLLLLLAILGLKEIEIPYSAKEIFLALLCISSEGAAILLLPLFGTRVILKRRAHAVRPSGEWLIIAAMVLFAWINFSISDHVPRIGGFSTYIDIFISHLIYFFVLHIFIGDNLVAYIQDYRPILAVFAAAVIGATLYLARRIRGNDLVLPTVLAVCALLLPVMIAMARPQNLYILTDYLDFDVYRWFRFRYSFFVPAVAAIFWTATISRITRPVWLPAGLVAAILLVQIYSSWYRIPIYRYPNHTDWHQQAPLLEQSLKTGCPPAVLVRINPRNWTVQLDSPIEAECDETATRRE